MSTCIADATQGDVIGCLLHMPEGGQPHERDISVRCSYLALGSAHSADCECLSCALLILQPPAFQLILLHAVCGRPA
jgi:hypothetical protein